MAYTTEDPHFRRITEAVDWHYSEQKRARQVHRFIIQHLLGEYYPTRDPADAGPPTPINLISMAYRATARHLISKSPRLQATTGIPQLRVWCENEEISANKRILRLDCVEPLTEFVRQSMASFGTLFLAPQWVGTRDGMKLDLGVEAIDRADYVFDLESSCLEKADFQGHKFRMKLVDAMECPMFDEECRMELDATYTDDSSNERSNFQRAFSHKASLYDYVDIWCIYDRPREKLVYFPRCQPGMRLAEVDWMGPSHGPYRYLYYEKPPGQAMPIAPLMHVLTKHRAFNELDMKSIHQQRAAKGVLFYTNASKAEAEHLVKATLNESVLQENGAVRYAQIGGAAQDTVAMAEKQKRDFSYATNGVLDQFMQQADTLGQERLLRGASNEMLNDMSGWAYQAMKGFSQDIFWFDVRDPDTSVQWLDKPTGAPGISYQVPWTREHRRFVSQFEFDVDVEPYSYVERSPSSRLADLLGSLQILLSFGDQMAAQGIMVDVEAVVRTVAKYKNLPELYEVLILNQDPERLNQLLGPRGNSESSFPTNRTYTRKSESDGSGSDMEMMRMFGRGQNREMVVA